MKKIAVINDLSGLGKCSLTAAIPVISAMGVQAVPLPTAILSNQTGYDSYYCDSYTSKMPVIMDEWEKRKFHPDGIYTGFLAGEEQADIILEFFRRFCYRDTLVLVDPVMGDQGKAFGFYTEGLCEKMRLLASKAHVITPNLTEGLLLVYKRAEMEKRFQELSFCGPKEYLSRIEELGFLLAEEFHLKAAAITGIDYEGRDKTPKVGNLVVEEGEAHWIFAEKTGGSYSGTGDLFASVLSAGLVKGMSAEASVEKAVSFLSRAIRDAVQEGQDRNDGVCFETYLHELWEE